MIITFKAQIIYNACSKLVIFFKSLFPVEEKFNSPNLDHLCY